MGLTAEQIAYRDKFKLKRLTFGIEREDLFLSIRWGAVTIERAMELDALHDKPKSTKVVSQGYPWHLVNPEIMDRNERHIDEHGCSIF